MPTELHQGDSIAAERSARRRGLFGYLWSTAVVALVTLGLWAVQGAIGSNQADLVYLPVVLFCATRFGYGQAILASILSFLSWDFFFLPPRFTFTVVNPRDVIALIIFLIAAVTTAWLSSRVRLQAAEAEERERDISILFRASEALSVEVDAGRVLPTLASQIVSICRASRCVVLRSLPDNGLEPVASAWEGPEQGHLLPIIEILASAALTNDQAVGFGTSPHLWKRALESLDMPSGYDTAQDPGIYIPLHAQSKLVGVLHVGPRRSTASPTPSTVGSVSVFTETERRLILTLSNYAAVVLARQLLSDQAAEANALRQADALKDALLSMVSHELRTPLATIKAAASGLIQPGSVWDSADRDGALVAIDVETDRLIEVVNNLLDLSRLEGGAWAPTRDWCEIGEIVGTVLGQRLVADRIDTEIPGDLPLIKADYVQIALVLTNLLQNALKYSEESERVELRATAASVTLGDHLTEGVVVAVRDHGQGIRAGEEAKIFDRFYRGERHRNSTVHGTGVGLTLCRAVIQAHGGQIVAANAEGGGALFTFFLPVE